jgi:polar amino acid transport system permease protein
MIPDLLQRYGLKLLEGLIVTLELVTISIVAGALLAVPLTAARLSRNRIVSALAFGYVYFFRGTPLLAQIFLVYYGAGQFRHALDAVGLWHLVRDAFTCTLITFSLNTAAYQAEIYRGAIRSVPRGQWEAARALGIGRFPLLTRVVLPQAAMIALRPLGNEIILMIKGSAVASIVTVYELMGETKLAFSRSYDLTIYLYAAVLYLLLVEAIRRIWNRLEAALTRHLRRERKQAMTTADVAPALR